MVVGRRGVRGLAKPWPRAYAPPGVSPRRRLSDSFGLGSRDLVRAIASARLCGDSHLGFENEPPHVDLRLKLLPVSSSPITVADVVVEARQPLVRLNHFEPVSVFPGGVPRSVFLEVCPPGDAQLNLKQGDDLVLRLIFGSGEIQLARVQIQAARRLIA